MITDHPSPNKSRRRKPITAIILHDTASHSAESALGWLTNPQSGVSCHYLVARDARIWRLVPDAEKAWHAGESSLFGEPDCNEFSIGIEIEDMTNDPYPEAQLEVLATLVARLAKEYQIPLNRIVGHQHVAPTRKVDPGPDFPWRDFLMHVAFITEV
jgi:N-acetylmuramoyl-L-alanine amidase